MFLFLFLVMVKMVVVKIKMSTIIKTLFSFIGDGTIIKICLHNIIFLLFLVTSTLKGSYSAIGGAVLTLFATIFFCFLFVT